MICTACGQELSAAFPGATVECACGTRVTLDTGAREAPVQSSPYRASGALPTDDMELRCPYCGNTCSASLRVCPRCDVRFDRIRCVRCYTLQPPGSFACGRCGTALELEALLDPTDAPCPRCRHPLEAAGGPGGLGAGGRIPECPRCGGLFVPRDALAELLHRAEVSGPFPDPVRAPVLSLDQVRYVPCPQCHTQMNRVNFGKVSGVIVDVCRAHGTWFDGGELTRVISFAASGGLDKTRTREAQEKKDAAAAKRENAAFQAALQPHARFLQHEQNERLEEWVTFLRDVLFW